MPGLFILFIIQEPELLTIRIGLDRVVKIFRIIGPVKSLFF